jgi:hypothetical protein
MLCSYSYSTNIQQKCHVHIRRIFANMNMNMSNIRPSLVLRDAFIIPRILPAQKFGPDIYQNRGRLVPSIATLRKTLLSTNSVILALSSPYSDCDQRSSRICKVAFSTEPVSMTTAQCLAVLFLLTCLTMNVVIEETQRLRATTSHEHLLRRMTETQ